MNLRSGRYVVMPRISGLFAGALVALTCAGLVAASGSRDPLDRLRLETRDNAVRADGCWWGGGGTPEPRAEYVAGRLALEKEAEAGDFEAQKSLAFNYLLSFYDLQNYHLAAKWLQAAAERGDGWSQCLLGSLYQQGLGRPHDDALAMKWYRAAAAQGWQAASRALGVISENSAKTPSDYAEAIRLLKQPSLDSDLTASIYLAAIYEKGEGVPVDLVQAYAYLTIGTSGPSSDEFPPKFSKEVTQARTWLASRMTPSQLVAGERSAREHSAALARQTAEYKSVNQPSTSTSPVRLSPEVRYGLRGRLEVVLQYATSWPRIGGSSGLRFRREAPLDL